MTDGSQRNAPLLVRGSVVKVRRRCGKCRCKCAQGKLHETWALSYSHNGRTRMVALRDKDVKNVRRAVTRYHTALRQLQSEALLGIKQLHSAIKAEKRRGR